MDNPVIESLLNHRSIRKFKQDPIPEETIRVLVSAGCRAATAGNLQMYSFLVIDDEERIGRLRGEVIPAMTKVPLVLVVLLDLYRIKRWLELSDARPPILNRPIYFMLGFWDATIALQNVVIAAESLGLGTCYYGSILEFDIHKHFGAPEHVFPAGMICLGYPDEDPPLSQRLPLEAILHRNHYQLFDDATIKGFYGEREKIWEAVPAARKKKLRKEGIETIPQALAVQRFSEEPTRVRSEGVLRNLERAGFTLGTAR